MPYLQVDLDAIDEFDAVATMTGLSFGEVCGGMLKLWQHCWRKKTAHVPKERLAGFFRGDPETVMGALVACEFISKPDDRPDLLVRGAEKRLGILSARSEAGKRARGNLKQFSGAASCVPVMPPGNHPGNPEVQPESTRPGNPEQNTGSYIQHPTSNIQQHLKEEGPPPKNSFEVSAPTEPEAEWGGPHFWRWFQSRRIAAGHLPEKWPRMEKLNAWWREVALLNVSVQTLKEAAYAFGEDSYWETAKPAHPWNAFASKWSSYAETEAA